jgi:hypothetical protein
LAVCCWPSQAHRPLLLLLLPLLPPQQAALECLDSLPFQAKALAVHTRPSPMEA